MKHLIKYISLLIFSGLILPYAGIGFNIIAIAPGKPAPALNYQPPKNGVILLTDAIQYLIPALKK